VPHHDVNIYLTVLYAFITLLILGVRHTGSRWATWYQKLVLLDDSTLADWYLDKMSSSTQENLLNLSEPAILKLARQALLHDILLERRRYLLSHHPKDPFVARLAGEFQATDFLMVRLRI
jgi:hypothetical protein